jgi:hypothetical protein
VASGWFKDPYGRHEARWMSAGTPTSLVRNGDVEQTDPPPSGGATFVPTDRADSRVGSPAPRSGTRRWAVVLLGLGVLGIAAGFFLLYSAQSSSPTTQTFTPTPAEIAAVHVGAASPSDCSQAVTSLASNPKFVFTVGPSTVNTQFTVPRQSMVVVVSNANESADIPGSDLFCQYSAQYATPSDGYAGEASLFLERPGVITVYYVSHGVHVVRIVVTSSIASSGSTVLGWLLVALGVIAIVAGIVFYRLSSDKPPEDLRRADDGGKTPGFDAQAAQRAAWDALDQSSGQF